MEKGAHVDAVGSTDKAGEECTSLWLAAMAVRDGDGEAGGLELVTLLLDQGADVNAVGTYRGTSAGAHTRPLLSST